MPREEKERGEQPVPAIPVPRGAVFGGRNGSCCGKRPPGCCSSAEPEPRDALPAGRGPPPLSGAPHPRPRPAPGARSKLSDMLRPGGSGAHGREERSGAERGGRAAGGGQSAGPPRPRTFGFTPAQRRDGRARPSRGSLETAFPKAPYSLRLHLHGNERGEVTVAGPRLQLQQERPAATGASRHAVHTHVYTREGWKSYRRNFKFNPIKLSLQHDHIIVWLGLLNETMIVQKKYIFIYNLCMM